jgi:hypothetical protein
LIDCINHMKSRIRLCLAAIVLMTAPACTTPKPAEPVALPAPEAPQLIGRIASIPADRRFVLIQTYGNQTIKSVTILTTRGPEKRSANLLATGESLGQFAAADLQSGSVEIGDAVYSQPSPQAVPPTPEPAPEEKPLLEKLPSPQGANSISPRP